METLTLVRNIVGNIALFFIAVFFLYYIVYHLLIKAVVLGWDLYKWRMIGADQQKIKDMGWRRAASGKFNVFWCCWNDCIGYNGDISWSRGSKRWDGYGTGR